MITLSRSLCLLIAASVLNLAACESLRPVAPEDEWSTPSQALQRAEQLLAQNAPFNHVTQALQLALDDAGDHQEQLRIRRLKAMVHLRWFQLAHIANDLLIGIEGNDRVFTSLVKELRSAVVVKELPKLKTKATGKDTVPLLSFLAPLIAKSHISAKMSEARRALVKELSQLSRKSDRVTRDFASYGRRYLTLEGSWHYNKITAMTKKRVREWVDYLNNFEQSYMAGHAWLSLRLTLAQALKNARIPTQSLLLALRELLGQPPSTGKKTPMELLLAMGKGEGKTLPERLYVAWQGVRSAVDTRLKKYQPAIGSSAEFIWSRISAFLALHGDAGRAAADDLHTLGDAVRTQAVSEWLVKNGMPGPGDPKLLTRLGQLLTKGAAEGGIDDPQWVMAVLTFQEILGARLADVSTVRSIRLSRSSTFGTRALRLPNARQIGKFPNALKGCVERRRAQPCLNNLLARALSLAKQRP